MSQKDQWVKYVRGCIYPQRHYPCLKGDFEVYSRYFRVPFTKQVYYGNEKILEWYLEKKFAFRLGKTIISDLGENNQYAREFRKNWKMNYERAKKTSSRIIWKIDLEKLSGSQLKKIYLDWFDASEHFNGISNAPIDAVDEVLQEDIRKEFRAVVKNDALLEEAWRILTTPTETTYVQKRDLEALELARKIKKDKKVKINWKNHKEEIRSLVKKYWWSTLGWMADKKYLEPDAKKEAFRFSKDKKLEEKYWQFKNFSKITEEAKKKELKKIHATDKLKKLLQVFEEIAVFKDQRKEGQVYLVAANMKLLQEIARRKKEMAYRDLVWLTETEIADYLEGKTGLTAISDKRKDHMIVIVTKNKITVKEGQEAWDLRRKLFPEEKIKQAKEFKGLPASRGQAKGKVLVTLSSDYANKHIKKGNILVTAQTTPDFVPAMRRAGAVVTDEGGATSHAAIISRELNIPCIVGAKIASDVLKTGDLVEVNATEGTVKILKRAKK